MPSKDLVHDLHVHTHFSSDSTEELEAYAEAGQDLACHVGYLDHFELAFQNREGFLSENHLPQLMEEYDKVHSRYPNTSLSLEVDYYSNLSSEVAEFCDEYRHAFDYLIGSVHVVDRLAVTSYWGMALLVQEYGLNEVLRRYFDEVEAAIRTGLFDGLAHIDAVMRYAPYYPEDFVQVCNYWQTRTIELGELCHRRGLLLEINLTGLNYPWGQTHPNQNILNSLIDLGVHFYVGSDSHSLEAFKNTVPRVRQMTHYLKLKKAIELPGHLQSRLPQLNITS